MSWLDYFHTHRKAVVSAAGAVATILVTAGVHNIYLDAAVAALSVLGVGAVPNRKG